MKITSVVAILLAALALYLVWPSKKPDQCLKKQLFEQCLGELKALKEQGFDVDTGNLAIDRCKFESWNDSRKDVELISKDCL